MKIVSFQLSSFYCALKLKKEHIKFLFQLLDYYFFHVSEYLYSNLDKGSISLSSGSIKVINASHIKQANRVGLMLFLLINNNHCIFIL